MEKLSELKEKLKVLKEIKELENKKDVEVTPDDLPEGAKPVDLEVETLPTPPPPPKDKELNECGECGATFKDKPDACPECGEELEWGQEEE